MSSVSAIGGSSDAWASMRSQMQAKMFAKADGNSDGGVDKTELKNMLSDVSKMTGKSVGGNIDDTFSKMDVNGDGKLSSDELGKGMESIMPPPPSTMDFAQSRSSSSSGSDQADALFSKIDVNGDGSIDKSELQTMTDKIKSATGKDAGDLSGKLDTDGDGKISKSEFAAGAPKGGPGGTGGPQGAGGPEGAGGSSRAGATKSADGGDKTYDPLDTNKDGTVSELERLIGQLKSVTASAGSDTGSATSSKADFAQVAQKMYEQFASGWAQSTQGSLSAMA